MLYAISSPHRYHQASRRRSIESVRVARDDFVTELWLLNIGFKKKLKVTQRAIEETMFGVSLCNKIKSEMRKSVEETRSPT